MYVYVYVYRLLYIFCLSRSLCVFNVYHEVYFYLEVYVCRLFIFNYLFTKYEYLHTKIYINNKCLLLM